MDVNIQSGDIPFAFFASLLQALSQIKPRTGPSSSKDTRAQDIFKRWVEELRRLYSPLPAGTTLAVFRLLFPEEDTWRRYGMQEARLASLLSDVFGLSGGGGAAALKSWQASDSAGCLGSEVERVLASRSTIMHGDSLTSLSAVNALLDELASLSPFSHATLRLARPAHPRTARAVLADLFHLAPREAAFLCQIILQDLRPLLCAPGAAHPTAALRAYTSAAVAPLTRDSALRVWDPSGALLRLTRARASLCDATEAFEAGEAFAQPVVGTIIQIPKSVKGQSCAHALQQFKHSSRIWVETKYDGERAQIHVRVLPNGFSRITIFSKSGRDSTLDRHAVHGIVREALGLAPAPPVPGLTELAPAPPIKDVVLEAEMVAYSRELDRIDEFWRIRSLIEGTAHGVRRRVRPSTSVHARAVDGADDSSQLSPTSQTFGTETRHLALVFFDVLVLDGASLLRTPYAARRAALESLVQPIPQRALLASRTPVELDRGTEAGTAQLRAAFAALVADHEEGAVLKADNGLYNDWRCPWVKLKKDYIPGLGDSVDLLLLGAGWDKDRARELRVPPSTYTTFYLGAVTSKADSQVAMESWFTCSYGLSREQLEELNFLISTSDTVQPGREAVVTETGKVTFSLPTKPSLVLHKPLVVEVFGAGFTKSAHSPRYELRFPRMAKYHRTCERAWADAVPAAALQALARAAVGRDRPHKDVDDAVAALWGKPVSPGVRSSPRKRAREAAWLERLERADGSAPKRARAQLVREDPQGNENVPAPAALAAPERRRLLRPPALRPMASSTNLAGALGALTMVAPLGSASPAIPPRISARDIPPTPEPSCVTQSRGSAVCDQDELPHTVRPSRKSFDALPTVSVLPPLAPPTLITPPPSDDDRVPSPGAPSASSSPLAAYLSTAMVWLARPCQSARPSSRVSLRALVPRQRVLHSLDALLIACGWRGTPPSGAHAVARGVVFVNVGADDAWAAHALRTLEAELAKLAAAGGCPTAKPIVVLDGDLLSHARLHEEHDFERDCVFLAEPRL